jgi:hypothetical protein
MYCNEKHNGQVAEMKADERREAQYVWDERVELEYYFLDLFCVLLGAAGASATLRFSEWALAVVV